MSQFPEFQELEQLLRSAGSARVEVALIIRNPDGSSKIGATIPHAVIISDSVTEPLVRDYPIGNIKSMYSGKTITQFRILTDQSYTMYEPSAFETPKEIERT